LRIGSGHINRPCTLLLAAPATPKEAHSTAQSTSSGYRNQNLLCSNRNSNLLCSNESVRPTKFVKMPVYEQHLFLPDARSENVRCFNDHEVARQLEISPRNESLLFGNGPGIPFDEDEHKKKLALAHAYKNIMMEMPKLLEHHDYSIYTDDVQFISKVGIIPSAKGLSAYKLTLQAWFASLQIVYSDLFLEVLHMGKSCEDYTVTVRWGLRGHQRLKTPNSAEVNFPFDGVSTFHVDVNGLIWKHVLDKKEKKKNSIFQAVM